MIGWMTGPNAIILSVMPRRYTLALILMLAVPLCPASSKAGDTYTDYRADQQTWIIGNSSVQAAFQVDNDGHFRFRWLLDPINRRLWRDSEASLNSPINLTVDGTALSPDTVYNIVSQSLTPIDTPASGVRFAIVLSTDSEPGEIYFQADVYDGQPFVRYGTRYQNLGPTPSYVTQADMLGLKFLDSRETYRDFFVSQWEYARASDFEPHETDLSSTSAPVEMYTGAYAQHAAWRAVRDSHDYGLVTAWEFNGRSYAHVLHNRTSHTVDFDAQINDLNHRVRPGEFFEVPQSFIGVFHGDWDEAGYRTQRFAEAVLAVPAPDTDRVPYVMFDTWGYNTDIDEQTVLSAASRAAELGAEVFILDFGWARNIGDWYPDPQKFPNGLRPISDYVHSLGMKFGLHLPLLEAAVDSPVLTDHPDWQAVDPERPRDYFGAASLCPSHRFARQWIISETLRVIRDYGVDWLTQDGENMVKNCLSATHSHAPGDSNYSNSVDGLDRIIAAVHDAEPGVVWENSEDGGSMQTFKMVQQYATSVLNDSDNAITTRRAVYGATYPFPARYTERYMQDEPDNTYETRSYMFGGPFIMMNRITDWSDGTANFVKREIDMYKSLRDLIAGGQIFHVTTPPDDDSNDAMQAYDPVQDRSVLFVYSNGHSEVTYVQPKGLNPNALYWIGFLEVPRSYLATGAQLMDDGIPVILPRSSAEVVSIIRR
jgi:alpha-galactosidase